MIILNLDNKSKIPLYIQIYTEIKNLIQTKILKANEKLPSKKDFIDYYLKLRPRKFEHFSSLAYCLAFRLNAGSVVGDLDNSKFFVPAIGVDI